MRKKFLTDFYDAWWYLYMHEMFQDEDEDSRLLERMGIFVAKVNPETCRIDEDVSKNTKVEVWLEIGKYDKTQRLHDLDLDCCGGTYEEAIINLANLVHKKYDKKNFLTNIIHKNTIKAEYTEDYCTTCHEFVIAIRKSEGNGNTGLYCPNCGMETYCKCNFRALDDIKKRKTLIFNNPRCGLADMMGCKEEKCPYKKFKGE